MRGNQGAIGTYGITTALCSAEHNASILIRFRGFSIYAFGVRYALTRSICSLRERGFISYRVGTADISIKNITQKTQTLSAFFLMRNQPLFIVYSFMSNLISELCRCRNLWQEPEPRQRLPYCNLPRCCASSRMRLPRIRWQIGYRNHSADCI